jgi:hypothetical protein
MNYTKIKKEIEDKERSEEESKLNSIYQDSLKEIGIELLQ